MIKKTTIPINKANLILVSVIFLLLALLSAGMVSGAQASSAPPLVDKLVASDAASGDWFGLDVSISGSNAIVGAYWNDGIGAAYLYESDGGSWIEVAKLVAVGVRSNDWFGYSVSISGNHAIVGAMRDDTNGLDSGAAYIFERIDGVWTETATLLAPDGAMNDFFGCSVAISGSYALVGAKNVDTPTTDSGAAYFFEKENETWVYKSKVYDTNGDSFGFFGDNVALSGDRAIIGAFGNRGVTIDTGAAYIYERTAGTWSLMSKISASDGHLFDRFGIAVDIDGDIVIVGAEYDDAPLLSSGSAYVFEYNGSVWSQSQRLTASDAIPFAGFGNTVSISEVTAVIGSPTSDNPENNSGSAYVFTKVNDAWVETQLLVAFDSKGSAQFGGDVLIDGQQVIIGAGTDDTLVDDSGSAYVFDFGTSEPATPVLPTVSFSIASATVSEASQISIPVVLDAPAEEEVVLNVSQTGGTANAGSDYYVTGVITFPTGSISQNVVVTALDDDVVDVNETAILTITQATNALIGSASSVEISITDNNTDPQPPANPIELTEVAQFTSTVSRFGSEVALRGNQAIVAAQQQNFSSTVFIFEKLNGSWTEVTELTDPDGVLDDFFGFSIGISQDTAIVGAYLDDDNGFDAGTAFIFEKVGGVWVQTAKLTAGDGDSSDRFGYSVAVDGNTAVVGAYWDEEAGSQAGSAYVFEKSGSSWGQTAKLVGSDTSFGDRFGASVSIDGSEIVVGASYEGAAGPLSGSAYVFEKSGSTWTEKAILRPQSLDADDRFGARVEIRDDRIVVGAEGKNDSTGVVYVFEKIADQWTLDSTLSAGDGMLNDSFGSSVSTSGSRIAISSPNADDLASNSGALYLFEQNANEWVESLRLIPTTAITNDAFGKSSLDGSTLLVSARESKTVYFYELVTSTDPIPSVTPEISFEVIAASVNEDGSVFVPVVLDVTAEQQVSAGIVYSITSAVFGEDFVGPIEVTFATGTKENTVVVTMIDDDVFEGPEAFTMSLFNPTNATLGSPDSLLVSITDNDTASPTSTILALTPEDDIIPGGTREICLEVSNADGIVGYRAGITFDSSQVTYVPGSATIFDTSTANGWLAPEVNSASSEALIFTSASLANPLPAGEASLLKFTVQFSPSLDEFDVVTMAFDTALTSINDGAIDFATDAFTASVVPINDPPFFTLDETVLIIAEDVGPQSISFLSGITPALRKNPTRRCPST